MAVAAISFFFIMVFIGGSVALATFCLLRDGERWFTGQGERPGKSE